MNLFLNATMMRRRNKANMMEIGRVGASDGCAMMDLAGSRVNRMTDNRHSCWSSGKREKGGQGASTRFKYSNTGIRAPTYVGSRGVPGGGLQLSSQTSNCWIIAEPPSYSRSSQEEDNSAMVHPRSQCDRHDLNSTFAADYRAPDTRYPGYSERIFSIRIATQRFGQIVRWATSRNPWFTHSFDLG
ncbi:uncharacterized protein LAESUDRAFT_313537 [Laetiporus sulphureus 93-53]|uniref:Uncharacterized protein n=1 Tax=Laetiporus sulphureus 93-53 TaxID=1314785 RepID=A0A165D5U0_9APHY|nr:uncharacterized protein LAESUDRAFT_313537 [Laetiporus sulphureus 93-53]KZT04204.1 hypothetical protein LAESUDRAFT_313537 [Laetiporus sulphureus 93-53]